MATEARTDGRPANQLDTQGQIRTERYEPRSGARQVSQPSQPMNQNMNMGPQVQEIRPQGDETKHALKTTEFWVWIAGVAAILGASWAVGVTATHNDYFRADKAWWFITLLTIGYLGSRGLAKAGSSTRSRVRENGRR